LVIFSASGESRGLVKHTLKNLYCTCFERKRRFRVYFSSLSTV